MLLTKPPTEFESPRPDHFYWQKWGIYKGIHTAAEEYAEAYRLLAGRASILEACRDWLKRNAVEFPKIIVADAAEKLKKQAETDGKSNDRQMKRIRPAADKGKQLPHASVRGFTVLYRA